jgi:hypothetical protein
VHQHSLDDEVVAYCINQKEKQHIYHEEAKAEWVLLDDSMKVFWESQSRSKIARQPYIRDNIIEAMRVNPSKSFEQISNDIDNWCLASTIFKWFFSHGYSTFVQRALPLLTEAQKKKHVEFSWRIRNN